MIITDSASSIQIVESFKTKVGMKPFLQAETDVGMEVLSLQQQYQQVTYGLMKVNSHIDKEDATNERYWELNDFVDYLATEARRASST